MDNNQIAQVFEDIAALLEIEEESVFTVRAYQRAARSIHRHPVPLEEMVREGQDLRQIPGVGKAIADKVTELVTTGKLGYYERLKARFPQGILEVVRVPGVGPKTARRLWKELGVTTVQGLEAAARDGRLAHLPRMGPKTAQNILRHLELLRSKDRRHPLGVALPLARAVMEHLRRQCPTLGRLEAAGSLRRWEETVGDVDLVCTAQEPGQVTEALTRYPGVADVLARGETKASVVLEQGLQVDLRVVEDRYFGSLLQYFTGSKQHNILLRDLANRMGLSLSEYGLAHADTGELETFQEEGALYRRLGLQYIPPELRQGTVEVERALEGAIPTLVEVGHIRGDLHVHTDWSDGRDPPEAMLAAAQERGYEYVAITDHSAGRGIANGLSVDRLRAQVALLRELGSRVGIRVLCGTELDIRADGSLDYPDEVLQELDWVIASVHSAMGQDRATMTERIIKAMRNPHVDAIAHPTTRLIGRRPPIEVDMEALLRAAADTGTALEINASPERLDLRDVDAHRARQLGVSLVIDSDAHTAEGLDQMDYGVAVARRAWCQPCHILNALPWRELEAYLTAEKPRRRATLVGHG